jgi:hypothetical protein
MRELEKRDMTLKQLAREMAARKYVYQEDYFRGIASGNKKPGRRLLAALEDYFGSAPPTAGTTAGGTDLSSLVSAIGALVERMSAANGEPSPAYRALLAETVREEVARQIEPLRRELAAARGRRNTSPGSRTPAPQPKARPQKASGVLAR